jgi:tRNA threonylcarbamoyladenosine biosynthesis protein TsaB
MIILGIETSTNVCGVGLTKDAAFLGEYRLLRGSVHAEQVPPAIETLLNDSGLAMQDLDGIAVSIGPGSFTGLRIGLGVAKGMALASEKPVIPVDTMDARIWQLPGYFPHACVHIPARKGEFYQGIYQYKDDGWKRIGEIHTVMEGDFGEALPSGDIVFIGDDTRLNKKRRDLWKINDSIIHVFPPFHSLPSGYTVACAGEDLLKNGHTSNSDELVPFYLKRFQGVE